MASAVKPRNMTLSFPNQSRRFDATKNRVCFWGYDNAIEISFFVAAEALRKFNPEISCVEAGYLEAFDAARERILAVADEVYVSSRKNSYAYVLAAEDF